MDAVEAQFEFPNSGPRVLLYGRGFDPVTLTMRCTCSDNHMIRCLSPAPPGRKTLEMVRYNIVVSFNYG